MVHTTHDTGIPEGTIVVGVDGSPGSDAALAEAVRLAADLHRPLTIVHAVEDSSLSQAVLTDARDAAVRRAPRLEVRTLLRVQDPRDLLVTSAEGAAVLVVGSRGRGPVRSLLLGSVSLSVSRHAPCPVIVVRPHHPGLVRRGVLVGAAGTSGAASALDFAFEQASVRGLPLTVAHVVPQLPVAGLPPYVVEPTPADIEEHRLLLAEAMAGMRERHPDVAVRVEVVAGHPPDVLVRLAEQMDLLVVGAHQGGSSGERSFHPVSTSVVERAHCPVAVVPPATPVEAAHG